MVYRVHFDHVFYVLNTVDALVLCVLDADIDAFVFKFGGAENLQNRDRRVRD